MTHDAILSVVQNVLKEKLAVSHPVAPHSRLVGDLKLDSMSQLAFVVELENRLQICFEEGEEAGLETVEDLVQRISDRLEEKTPNAH